MVIDGTGAPPAGPMDVIVEGNRIARIVSAGTPGLPLQPKRPPQADHEIDATGMYLMPGFINLHAHLGDAQKAPDAEYTFKLWMANGITTIRGVELATQPLAMREKTRSAANATVDAAHLQLPASRPRPGPTVRSTRRRKHARGCAGARRTASTA